MTSGVHEVSDRLDALLVDAQFELDEPYMMVGISERWIKHPRLAWYAYALGFIEPPVVMSEQALCSDACFRWIGLYGPKNVYGAYRALLAGTDVVPFARHTLSPTGTEQDLPTELIAVMDQVDRRNIPYPQVAENGDAVACGLYHFLSLGFLFVTFQSLSVPAEALEQWFFMAVSLFLASHVWLLQCYRFGQMDRIGILQVKFVSSFAIMLTRLVGVEILGWL